MNTDDIPIHTINISHWIPTTDPHLIAVLGKLGEEASELSKICQRTLIQGGLYETDPVTGKTNVVALQEEIADIQAMCASAVEQLNLDAPSIIARMRRKFIFKKSWFDYLQKRDN